MIRKLLTVAAAVAAVVAFAPAANAATPSQLDVGSSTTGNHNVTAANKGTITVTVGSLSLGCTSASASGQVHAGAKTATSRWLDFTTTTFVGCNGPGGLAMNITDNCNLGVKYNSANVTTPVTDNPVAGLLDAGPATAGCLHAQDAAFGGFLCSLDIAGTTSAAFNENVKTVSGVNYQDLTISGNGLTVQNVSGCFGQVTNGTQVGLALTFNIQSPNGLINHK